MFQCDSCPAGTTALTASPAAVECVGDVLTWAFVSPDQPVHLVALFRDPGIRDKRSVPTVLDLRNENDGHVRAGTNCWVGPMLRSLGNLPRGLRVALDNGVRCPCPRTAGCSEYRERVTHCLSATAPWLENLRHPDGGSPGVLVCNKDLAGALAGLGRLTWDDGSAWRLPPRFIDAIGQQVRCFGRPALVCPHPINLSPGKAYCGLYDRRIKEIELASAIRALARL